MLSITFLGTSGSIPTKKRGLSAIALRWQGKIFLWDCGEGTQRQMMNYGVPYGSLHSIFLSHLHLDHFLGVYGLIETLHLTQVAPRSLTIYSPGSFPLLARRAFVDMKEIRKGMLLDGEDFSISAYPNEHSTTAYGFVFQEKPKRKFHADKAHRLGLKGRLFREIQQRGKVQVNGKTVKLEEVSWLQPGIKVVYSGDSRPSKTTTEAAKNADLLIHEATFGEDKKEEALERLHTTAHEAATLARKAKVKKLVLTHISSRYADSVALLNEAKKAFPSTEIAEDGLLINL